MSVDDLARRKATQTAAAVRLLTIRVLTLENKLRAVAASSDDADE